MAFDEEIRNCIYKSPSGEVFTLSFDDSEITASKKLAVHEFPQTDNSNIQDLGNATVTIPLKVFFSGDDYKQKADEFWDALGEKGKAELKHHRLGNIKVIPQTWTRTESLVEGLGRIDFSITFLRVSDFVGFPVTATSYGGGLKATKDSAFSVMQDNALDLSPSGVADRLKLKEDVLSTFEKFEESLKDVIAQNADLQALVLGGIDEISKKIDKYISTPLEFVRSMLDLVNLPAKVIASVKSKIEGYKGALKGAISVLPRTLAQSMNRSNTIAAICLSMGEAVTVGDIRSKKEADYIIDTLTAAVSEGLGELDKAYYPDVVASILESQSVTREYLKNIKKSLKGEKIIEIETERTLIDVLAEVSGSIEELDEFVEYNELQGQELLLIPRGRHLVYYV